MFCVDDERRNFVVAFRTKGINSDELKSRGLREKHGIYTSINIITHLPTQVVLHRKHNVPSLKKPTAQRSMEENNRVLL
jgi:hypothetical protein